MTPRERAEQTFAKTLRGVWDAANDERAIKDVAITDIEQAIIAAVAEKEARIAELESIITHSRQTAQDAWLGHKIKAAVAEEREECAKIADWLLTSSDSHAAELIGDRIRARNKSDGGTK